MDFIRSSFVRNFPFYSGRLKRIRSDHRMARGGYNNLLSSLSNTLTESTSDDVPLMRKGMSVYDRGVEDWRQWYSAAEYINPWDTAFRDAPLDFAKQYDYMTQHVMSLLQSFHQFDANSVTTEICNVLLHKLLELLPAPSTTSSSSKQKGNESTSAISPEETVSRSTRVASRALAILQSMEWIEREANLQQHQQQQQQLHSGHTSSRIPRAIPKPNRETYNTLLHIYSRTAGPPHIARTAKVLVEKMEQRYTQQQELDMKVTNFHWNSVLLAWSLCSDPNRIVWATQLLLRNAARPQVGAEIVDASSYIHVLRMCSRHGQAGVDPQQWAHLGAHVAVQLWQEMFERDTLQERFSDNHDDRPLKQQRRSLLTEHLTEDELRQPLYIPDLPPHFYNHFFHAIRSLPKGALRDEYFSKCMERACKEGVVNPFVLKEFFVHAQSPEVWNRFLGQYRTQVYGMTPDVAVAALMQLVPPEWTARAAAVSYSRPSNSNSSSDGSGG